MSIKQLLLNMSAEARQEVRELLDFLEGNTPAIPEAESQIEQTQDVQSDPVEEHSPETPEAPSETPAA